MFTYERPYHLKRSLSYWGNSKCKVVIADGSQLPLENIPDNIEYLHRPGAPITERILELIDNVNTKYAVFVPDDDFLGYEALDSSISFLEDNAGYSSVQGIYTSFRVTKPFGIIVSRPGNYDYARNYNWDDDSYVKRLEDINSYKLMHYCYSVVTVDTLRTLSNLFSGLENLDGSSLFEVLMAYSIAINGKTKTLSRFFSARETVARPDWLGIKPFENFINNNSPQYKILIENIASECIKLHGGDRQKAIEVAKASGKIYAASIFQRTELLSKKNHNASQYSFYGLIRKYVASLLFAIKILLQSTGITRSKGINKEYFLSSPEAWFSYKRDWKRIRTSIEKK